MEINWNAQWKNKIFENDEKRSYLFLQMNSSFAYVYRIELFMQSSWIFSCFWSFILSVYILKYLYFNV